MRGVIVADNVNLLILGRRLIDLAQKRQPFLMAMPLGAGAQHLPCQGVQCRKQGRGTMTLIVVSHGSGASWLHRQSRLRSIQRLNGTLLVNTENNGILWRR